MALDPDKLRAHLKESGIFSDAEIDAEVLSAQKDDKAEERRAILNTQKVETAPVAQSSPAIAAAAAPPAPGSGPGASDRQFDNRAEHPNHGPAKHRAGPD